LQIRKQRALVGYVAGQPFPLIDSIQGYIYWLTYRDRPVPDARVAIYPFKREFVVGALAEDIQGGVHSMCYLPGRETPERECWYINMGAVDRKFFDPDSMVKWAVSGGM